MIARACIYSLISLGIQSTALCQTENSNVHFQFGMSLVASPDYKDALLDAYSNRYDISGAIGWVGMEAGLSFNVAQHLYLIPRLGLLASFIEIKAFSNLPSSRKANSVVLVGGATRYSFDRKQNSFYLQASLASFIPHSDLNDLEIESDGFSIGLEVGMVFSKKYELGIGYLSVPVKVAAQSFEPREGNFGGVSLVVRRRFGAG